MDEQTGTSGNTAPGSEKLNEGKEVAPRGKPRPLNSTERDLFSRIHQTVANSSYRIPQEMIANTISGLQQTGSKRSLSEAQVTLAAFALLAPAVKASPRGRLLPGRKTAMTAVGDSALAAATNTGSGPGVGAVAGQALIPDISPTRIPTGEVIASLLKQKKNKRVKESSMATYEKRFKPFAQQFPFLPEKEDVILEYLARFGGESGRHRRNNQDLLNMLYRHAVRRFHLPDNPLANLERPQITHKPIKVLSPHQARLIIRMPETLDERVALDLMLGHGWRQVEVRRILAADVAEISEDTILCHGKEREELTPVLPETQDRLKQMAAGLAPGEHLFVSRRARHGKKQPLGEDGMSQLVDRLFQRAGIEGITGHDLRRTFATMVTVAGKDELLAMRLLRDAVPGVGSRYIKYPMGQLVAALKMYSPVKLDGKSEKPPVPEAGEDLVETGES